jgi:predicted Zn-dependent protease
MTDVQVREWFDAAQREARGHGVRDVEVYFAEEESALTRFANNGIHQNVSEESRAISIRVAIGKKTARATTNRFDRIRETTQAAIALARASEQDEHLQSLYAGAVAAPVDRWDESTAVYSPQGRAEIVREAIAAVADAGHSAAGIFSTARSRLWLARFVR